MSNPDQYLHKAKDAVATSTGQDFTAEDLFIVWFAKTLGNWKALISTDKTPGLYWEVTYNGAKQETYVDAYTKAANTCLKDAQ